MCALSFLTTSSLDIWKKATMPVTSIMVGTAGQRVDCTNTPERVARFQARYPGPWFVGVPSLFSSFIPSFRPVLRPVYTPGQDGRLPFSQLQAAGSHPGGHEHCVNRMGFLYGLWLPDSMDRYEADYGCKEEARCEEAEQSLYLDDLA